MSVPLLLMWLPVAHVHSRVKAHETSDDKQVTKPN